MKTETSKYQNIIVKPVEIWINWMEFVYAWLFCRSPNTCRIALCEYSLIACLAIVWVPIEHKS